MKKCNISQANDLYFSLFSGMCDKKANYFNLLGRTLNVLPTYDPQAQEALARAVKLDPLLVEAWNSLGECLWKKGDIEAAKNCFTGALEHVICNLIIENFRHFFKNYNDSS